MDYPTLKADLRKKVMAERGALSPEEVRAKSESLFLKWRNRFSLRQIAWLHLFKTMDKFNEVETHFFEEYLRAKHPRIKIAVPVMDKVNKKLRHARITNDIEMVTNKFGVPEPKMPVEWVYPMMIDMVLVPLLAFDEKGNRLGYGGGYYDRFLEMVRPQCLKIGLAFELSKQEAVFHQEHDVPLDFVVTEETVYRCNPNLAI
jgi:5-formyltetrahydrofolate cyclo-ligase